MFQHCLQCLGSNLLPQVSVSQVSHFLNRSHFPEGLNGFTEHHPHEVINIWCLLNYFPEQVVSQGLRKLFQSYIRETDGMRISRCHLTSIFKVSSAEKHTAQSPGSVIPPCSELFISSLQGESTGYWKQQSAWRPKTV